MTVLPSVFKFLSCTELVAGRNFQSVAGGFRQNHGVKMNGTCVQTRKWNTYFHDDGKVLMNEQPKRIHVWLKKPTFTIQWAELQPETSPLWNIQLQNNSATKITGISAGNLCVRIHQGSQNHTLLTSRALIQLPACDSWFIHGPPAPFLPPTLRIWQFRHCRASKLMASATRLQISAMRRLPTQTMREKTKV